MKTDLIDRIYECSLVPDLWPGVLDDLAELADSHGGLLFSARDRVLKWTASANLKDIFRSYVEDGWFSRCPRRVCLFGQSMPGFFVEHDFWTADQLESKAIYRDFFRPHGLGWSAGTGLQMPTGDHIVFSVERQHSRGPIERERVEALNELRSHLARSAFVSARLGLQRAKGANDALTSMGLPALLLDESGAVVEANRLIEDLGEQVQWRARNRVALTDGRANELLWAALAALGKDPNAAVRSFPLRDTDDRASMVAHLIPVRRSAHDIFTGSYALLVLTPVAAAPAPPVELMRSLFDLTPSEARVARGLAVGRNPGRYRLGRWRCDLDRALATAPGAGKDRMRPPGRSGVAARQRHARSKRQQELEPAGFWGVGPFASPVGRRLLGTLLNIAVEPNFPVSLTSPEGLQRRSNGEW